MCDNHNNLILSKLNDIITIPSIDTLSSSNTTQYDISQYIPRDERDTAGLCTLLHVAVNARVMLRRNLCTTDGLVNGATGTVTGFVTEYSKISQILVLFDDPSVGISRKIQTNSSPHLVGSIPITRITANFFGKVQTTITLSQFPLILCFATTIHKVQGLTLTSATMHLGKQLFTSGMAYVALSRLTSPDGLRILHLHFKSAGFKASKKVMEEMTRLR